MISDALWSSWEQGLESSVRTVVVYALALVAVRVAGRRTLAQLSAFDVLVTVAAGTVVGSTALPSQPAVSDGVAVLATLFLLQVLIAGARQRSSLARRLLDFPPRVVVRTGRVDVGRSPTTAQLTPDEVVSQLRQQGVTELDDVRIAVLEPTGRLSVLRPGPGAASLFPPDR